MAQPGSHSRNDSNGFDETPPLEVSRAAEIMGGFNWWMASWSSGIGARSRQDPQERQSVRLDGKRPTQSNILR